MNILDILILALIAAALVLAWRVARRKKGGCSGCSGGCDRCDDCRKVCDMRNKKKDEK